MIGTHGQLREAASAVLTALARRDQPGRRLRTETPSDKTIAVHRPLHNPLTLGPPWRTEVSQRFAEWLMGLDNGHISIVPGFTLNEALKLAGTASCRTKQAA